MDNLVENTNRVLNSKDYLLVSKNEYYSLLNKAEILNRLNGTEKWSGVIWGSVYSPMDSIYYGTCEEFESEVLKHNNALASELRYYKDAVERVKMKGIEDGFNHLSTLSFWGFWLWKREYRRNKNK